MSGYTGATCNHRLVQWRGWDGRVYRLYCAKCGAWINSQETEAPPTFAAFEMREWFTQPIDSGNTGGADS